MIPFVKVHGCGNDFVAMREADLAAPAAAGIDPAVLAERVCDRRYGIGGDGLLIWGPRPARDGFQRVRMTYWNSDGSRAEMCGNGARCIVRLAWEHGEVGSQCVLETDAGDRPARVRAAGSDLVAVEIDMGRPVWDPEEVPVRAPAPVVLVPMQAAGRSLQVTALSMGNPHAVVFVDDPDALARVPLAEMGPALGAHSAFPRGANASFVAAAPDGLHLRTWERGAGATLACGTATCAALAAARRAGYLDAPRTTVHQPGGVVDVWEAADGHLWMSGPAVVVGEGTLREEWLRG